MVFSRFDAMPENVVWSQEWYIYSGLGSACVDTIQQKVTCFSFFHRTAELRALPTKTPPWFVCCPFDLRRCPTAWCASLVGHSEKNRILEQTTFDPYFQDRNKHQSAKNKIVNCNKSIQIQHVCQFANLPTLLHLTSPPSATKVPKIPNSATSPGMASLNSAVRPLGPVLPRDGRTQYHFTLVQNRRRSAGRPCKREEFRFPQLAARKRLHDKSKKLFQLH